MRFPKFLSDWDGFSDILQQFEDMLNKKKPGYFDVEIFTEITTYLIETNQKEKAQQAIKMALLQHPNSEELQLEEARINILSENFEKAKHRLKALHSRKRNSPEIYYYLGKMYLGSRKISKAIRFYDSALALSDTEEKTVLLYKVTDDMMDKGHYGPAINYLHQIVEIDHYDFEAIMDIGTCYRELNQIPQAINEFNQYLNREPFNELIWYQLGGLYEDINRDEKAIEAYEFAAAIEPEYSSAYFGLALLFSRQKAYQKAIKYLELLIEQEPQNMHAYFYLAEAYYQLADTDKAMLNYEKTLALDTEFADAWFGIGEIYYSEQKINESLLYIRKAIKCDPQEPLYWLRLGKIQQNIKLLSYAIKSFNKVRKLDPYDENAAIYLAECYFEFKNFEKVIEICNQVQKMFNDVFFDYLRGGALLEKGDQESGLEALKQGLEKNFEAFDNFVYFYPKILSFDAVKKLVNKYQGTNQ